jgi:hypothetical protein
MLRSVLALCLLLFPIAALAAPSPAPGGMIQIDGRVTANDNKSTIEVDGNRGHVSVSVPPSTSIQGRDAAYHTLIDVKPGMHVQIVSSLRAGTYVAQIITLVP